MNPDYNVEDHLQIKQPYFTQKLFGSKLIPAGGETIPIAVSSFGAFRCLHITGEFQTLDDAGADDGVNHLSCRLNDTGRSLKLFEEFIPCSLFLSPGRTRTSGVAGDPSNQLFFPNEFDYTFIPNSTIELEMKNDSQTSNLVKFCFHGIRYRLDWRKLIRA